jgi:CubicO group peptidase (beta-lactamase class C family)
VTDFDGVLARLPELVEDAVRQGQAPGVVAAIADGASLDIATAGVMTLDGPPMRPDTLFRITSNTKPMTAVAVLSLIEDGLLTLDEPIDRVLPELAGRQVLRSPDGPLTDTVPANRAVTVRDLLTFTWGFGMQGAMFLASEPWPIMTAAADRQLATFGPPQPGTTPDPATWLARLAELPLLAQPGERWLYQSGSQVLGLLASRVAGAPFSDVLHDRVFAPLGMTDTAFHAIDIARLATAYERRDDGLHVIDPPAGQWSRPPAFADGGAGLVSSVTDMVAFGRMLIGGGSPVLTAATVAQMTRNQLSPSQQSAVWPGFSLLGERGWGYGVSVLEDGSYTWEGGYGTVWCNVPARDLTVVVLTQRAADQAGLPAICSDLVAAARLG